MPLGRCGRTPPSFLPISSLLPPSHPVPSRQSYGTRVPQHQHTIPYHVIWHSRAVAYPTTLHGTIAASVTPCPCRQRYLARPLPKHLLNGLRSCLPVNVSLGLRPRPCGSSVALIASGNQIKQIKHTSHRLLLSPSSQAFYTTKNITVTTGNNQTRLKYAAAGQLKNQK